jgi:signal transduction histidine kinase
VIRRSTERLHALVEDLLLIAQIEARRVELQREPVDLARLASGAVEAARPAAQEKGVTLDVVTDHSQEVSADRSRIAQVVDNLVSNAVKFTPAGGKVEVTAGSVDDRVWIEVRDTGIGIDADDQERLFNKFFRTRAATKASIQGTGLGLAISKAIVQAHGGSIHVESAAGEGTTFRVELPVGLRAPSPASAPTVNA